jgi:uncharacterized membrane protein YdbT with pleckstrin-like domain
MTMNEETLLFRGTPSQLLNAKVFAACLVMARAAVAAGIYWSPVAFAALVVPLALGFWVWLRLRLEVYEVTSQRIRIRQGILTRRTEEMELYRVEDVSLVEPIHLRLIGRGNLEIKSNDSSTPVLLLPALKGVEHLREILRQAVEQCRERKRVRVTEME